MSKKNNTATIADLRNVSKVVKKAKERPSKLVYSKIAEKDDLIILGQGDASFKIDDKSIGGNLLLLANTDMTRAAPIYWKAKTISRVCYSSKDAETINLVGLMEDAVYLARQVEILLFGDYQKRIKVHLFTDSESTLESIASSKQIERKTLRQSIVDLKERLIDGDIQSYSWLPTGDMMADMMTKEMRMPFNVEQVIMRNIVDIPKPLVNEVVAIGPEIRMRNIQNR